MPGTCSTNGRLADAFALSSRPTLLFRSTFPECKGNTTLEAAARPIGLKRAPIRYFVGGQTELRRLGVTFEQVSISFEIDPAKRTVFLRYSGVPTYEEFRDTMLHAFLDRDYRVGFNFLTDRRGKPPDPSYMHAVADFLKEHSAEVAGSRWAMVVGSTAGLSMSQMLQALLADVPLTIRLFGDAASAEEWLLSG